MPYLIIAKDYENRADVREAIRDKHRVHLKSIGKCLIASGALLDEKSNDVIGGISLVDFDCKAKAEEFAFQDPYALAGIRKSTEIIKWRQRWSFGNFL